MVPRPPENPGDFWDRIEGDHGSRLTPEERLLVEVRRWPKYACAELLRLRDLEHYILDQIDPDKLKQMQH